MTQFWTGFRKILKFVQKVYSPFWTLVQINVNWTLVQINVNWTLVQSIVNPIDISPLKLDSKSRLPISEFLVINVVVGGIIFLENDWNNLLIFPRAENRLPDAGCRVLQPYWNWSCDRVRDRRKHEVSFLAGKFHSFGVTYS